MKKESKIRDQEGLIEAMTEYASPTDVIAIRLALGMSQREFSDALSVSEFTVWRWENGQVSPSPIMVNAMYSLAEKSNQELQRVRRKIRRLKSA